VRGDTVELLATALVFGIVGVVSPTRTAMTVVMLTSRVSAWPRAVAYAVGSTAVFAVAAILGLLGVQASGIDAQVPITIALGLVLVGVGIGMAVSQRRNADRPPADPRHPLLSAAGVGVGVSIQAPARLLVLLAGGFRIGDLADSTAAALGFTALMLAVWQVPIWGTMALALFQPDRFEAIERRARPALDRVEGGILGAVLVAAVGILLVWRGLNS
jgi:hypothetical protein